MIDPTEALPAKVQVIEDKLDALSASVEARFDEVTYALVGQREYTDSAFERLRHEMASGFRAMSGEFGRLERKLDQVIDRLTRPRSDS